jgi:hypothetical protein
MFSKEQKCYFSASLKVEFPFLQVVVVVVVIVYEGTDVYHTVLHKHGFHSMDCTKNLEKKFVDKKFSYARIKCKAIINNVCVPWVLEDLKNDLKCANKVLQCF